MFVLDVPQILINCSNNCSGELGLGKKGNPGLNDVVQYLSMVQNATTTIPIPKGEFFQDSALINFTKAPELTTNSLYLRVTVDPNAHLILDTQINSLKALTLVNSGATGVFMHSTFVKQCKVVVQHKVTPQEVWLIDGRIINLGLITHQAQVELVIGGHKEILLADITNTGWYACILDTPWLTSYDPIIR